MQDVRMRMYYDGDQQIDTADLQSEWRIGTQLEVGRNLQNDGEIGRIPLFRQQIIDMKCDVYICYYL